MVVDIGEVKRHIKPKADSTLLNMRKADLIEYIRCLEHNYNVAVSFNENQARYIESLNVVEVVRCKDCKHYMTIHCTCDGCCISDDWYCADGERESECE